MCTCGDLAGISVAVKPGHTNWCLNSIDVTLVGTGSCLGIACAQGSHMVPYICMATGIPFPHARSPLAGGICKHAGAQAALQVRVHVAHQDQICSNRPCMSVCMSVCSSVNSIAELASLQGGAAPCMRTRARSTGKEKIKTQRHLASITLHFQNADVPL